MKLTTNRKNIEKYISYLLDDEQIKNIEEGIEYDLLDLITKIDKIECFIDLLYSTNEDSTQVISKIGGAVLHKHLFFFENLFPNNLQLRNIIEFKLNGGDLKTEYFNALKNEFEVIEESYIKKRTGILAGSIIDPHEFFIEASGWYIFDCESIGLIIENIKKAIKAYTHREVAILKHQSGQIQNKKDDLIIKQNSRDAISSWVWGSYSSDREFDERWKQIEKILKDERVKEIDSFVKIILLLELAH